MKLHLPKTLRAALMGLSASVSPLALTIATASSAVALLSVASAATVTVNNSANITNADMPTLTDGDTLDVDVTAGTEGSPTLATWKAQTTTAGVSATVDVGQYASLTVGKGDSYNAEWSVFARGKNISNQWTTKPQTINLASNSTLNTEVSLAGWHQNHVTTVVNMETGSTWNINPNINDACEYMNQTKINMNGATINIGAGKYLQAERETNTNHNVINVFANSGTSTITGDGSIKLQNVDLTFGVEAGGYGTAADDTATTPTLSIAVAIVQGDQGDKGITKDGDSILELTNANNSYAGNTVVNGGTLRLAGAEGKAGTGTITVGENAILELAHTAAYRTTNAITLNGNLLVSGVDETVTSALTLASGKTMTIAEHASLTLTSGLTSNGTITLKDSSTLTLGGTVNITNQINNNAGRLVLKDGVVVLGITGGGVTVGSGKSLTYVGAASSTYATETDLSQLVTNVDNVTKVGVIARHFSNVTFQNGSTLVIDNGQTVASAPNIAAGASITLEVGAGHTGTWSSAAQPGSANGRVSSVTIGTGGTLIVHQGTIGQFCAFNHPRLNTNNQPAEKDAGFTIALADKTEGGSATTLETYGSIFGWDNNAQPDERTVDMGKGSQWLLHAKNNGAIWFNQTTTVLDHAKVIIDAAATVAIERYNSKFKTEATSAGQSTISGGTISLKDQNSTKLVFDVARSTTLGTSSTADLLVSSMITGATQHNIEKTGTGILELTANNTFTKAINVNGGTLRLAGSAGKAGTGAITVGTDATLELAHTQACTTANAITLNGNLLVSGGSTETLSGSITGTLQHVTLSAGATLGLSGSGASMSIGLSKLTVGANSGFYLANNARLTLGENSDGNSTAPTMLIVEGDGTAVLEKTGNGAITVNGNVSLNQVTLTGGTLNLAGNLSLGGALTATKGALSVSGGSNVIGGGLVIGNAANAEQSAEVVFNSNATINGNIQVGRGTLRVEGGTVTSNGTIQSNGAENGIKLQGSGKFIHENIEYSVLSGLAAGEQTLLHTTADGIIGISLEAADQQTVISNAAINVLGTDAVTITAGLDNVDIIHQAGEGLTFGGDAKTIRNLQDYTGKAMTNSAALTVTGTLSLSGTLTLTGEGSLTGTGSLSFDPGNLVLNHGLSGFTTLDGSTPGYSNDKNGYITGNSFVIIDASAVGANLDIQGEWAGGLSLSGTGDKVIYTVGGGNDNTYYINVDADYSTVELRKENDLVLVTDNHTLTLNQDFDNNHRLGTASNGWVALGNGVSVTNFGQTPADVQNIKVKTDARVTISDSVTGIAPINTLLESNSQLTVESGAQLAQLDFGNLTLSERSTLNTARDISATLVSAAGGTLNVGNAATAVLNLRNAAINMNMSGAGTIELHNDWTDVNTVITTNANGFTGTCSLSGNMELHLSAGGATVGGKIDLHEGQVRLVSQNDSVIAGLSGNNGEVYAAGGNRTLTIRQSDNSTFAGVIKNNSTHTLSITKENDGNLTLTGANTSTGTLTVNGGTVTLGGVNGAWAGTGDINIGASGTLAFDGGEKTWSQDGTIANGAHIKTLNGVTLSLTKAIGDGSAPVFNIAEGTTLKVNGNGDLGGSKFEGTGTLRFEKTDDIRSRGNNFAGTLDIASGLFSLGAIGNGEGYGKGNATFNASKVLVHNRATFQTNNGNDDHSNITTSINSTFYAESGSTLKNMDGHSKWSGKIHLNVSDVTNLSDPENPECHAGGTTKMLIHWGKYVVWDALVKGVGTLDIVGGNWDGGNAHCLVLNNDSNTFQGTYHLVGKTSNDGTFKMELKLNQANAAKDAIINIDASAAASAGMTNLLVGANATIAGLMGTANGTVKADGGAHTLTIDQSSNTEFAGTIANGAEAAHVLGITKANTGTLTLSGENTYTGATTVAGGTLEVTGTGSIGSTSEVAVSGDGTLKVSGGSVSVTAGNGTVTARANGAESGTAKKVTINSSGIRGATSGEGDALKALGELSSMTLTFAAENTAAAISNVTMRDVTMRDVTLSGGAVSMNGVVAIASSFAAEQAEPAPARMMALSAEADTGSTGTQTLTATPVKTGGSISGELTVDIDGSVLRPNAGKTLTWTILQGVSLADRGSFTLKLGDVLKTIVENGKPTVTLSGDWVRVNDEGERSVNLTAADLGNLSTGNLLAASVAGGDLVLKIENVPEPTTGTLSVLALAALAARRRRRE